MIPSSPQINHLSASAFDWYTRFVAAADARDLDGFASFLHDDCVVQINDNLPVYGKIALFDAMAGYYDAFEKVEHEILNVYGDDTHFTAEVLCHYTPRIGGARVTMPVAAIYDRNEDGLIVSLRLYVGAGGMFQVFTGAQGQ